MEPNDFIPVEYSHTVRHLGVSWKKYSPEQTQARRRQPCKFADVAAPLSVINTPPMPQSSLMLNVQIFGVKDSNSTRAAQRFFKERGIKFQFVDLRQKPMSPAEIKRFADRFGISSLIDTMGKAYVDEGLQYLNLTDSEWLDKIERNPKLLRLPLVRSGNRISVGQDDKAWKEMLVS